MALTLHYHPYTRAAGTIWALEEVGQDYQINYVDMQAGAQKGPEITALNPMGKLPLLIDTGPDGSEPAIITEAAAIALYLADRYASGHLAPALDDPARGTFLRWILYSPSVIEPGLLAKAANWPYKAGTAGWGDHDSMLTTMETAIGDGPWLLGDRFTMADVVFGGTIRWMLGFGMLEKREAFVHYAARLDERPAAIKAREINEWWIADKGLQRG